MLKQSIRIFLPDSLGQAENNPRIWLSSGTYPAADAKLDRVRYRDRAFLPQEPWRQPTSAELSLLVPKLENDSQLDRWDFGSDLGVVRIPPDCLSPLAALNLHSIENISDRSNVLDEEIEVAPLSQRILECYQNSTKNQVLGINISPPDLITTTLDHQIDPLLQTYAGMHLDSWDLLPLKHRHKSRNRLCINLGREDRFFLFINLRLMDMFRALGLSETTDIHKHYRGLKLAEKFMRQNPTYPVVKLRISPGEAYIAPSDNIIHDATNRGSRYPDITLTSIGYYSPSPIQLIDYASLALSSRHSAVGTALSPYCTQGG